MTRLGRMSLLFVAVAVGAAGLSCRKSVPPPRRQFPPATVPTTSPTTAPTSLAATVPSSVPVDPDSFQGLMGRGNAALGAGELARAAELFALAVERAKGLDRGSELLALKGLVNALTLAERTAEAADVYRSILEADPSDHTTRFNLAVALTRLRHFSEAEAMYGQLLTEQADFVQARYNLAALYQAQGKLAQARDQWRQVVRQAPQLASAQTALGEVLLQLGQVGEAQATFDAATRLAEGDPAAWRGLAIAAQATGNLERASAAARREIGRAHV